MAAAGQLPDLLAALPMDADSCIYCDATYPPAERSREHVLQDFLGGRIKLPDNHVCLACNSLFNREIDQKLRTVFQPIITWFDASSSKRPSETPADVVVNTDVGPARATLGRDRSLRLPARQLLDRIEDGSDAVEAWLVTDDQLEGLVASIARRAERVEQVGRHRPQVNSVSAPLRGKANILVRAATRAVLNYLAYRAPLEVQRPSLRVAKDFVRTGSGWLTAEAAKELVSGQVDMQWLEPRHRIAIWTEGGRLCGYLSLFYGLWCAVELVASWDGPALAFAHDFRVADGSAAPADHEFTLDPTK